MTPIVRPARASLAIAAALLLAACGKSHDTPDAGDASAASAPSAAPSVGFLTKRDPGARPPIPVPQPPASITPLPTPKRPPDWDLSSDDPALDYARRYAFFTKRYGDNLDCVVLGPSQAAGSQRSVEVKTAPSCPGAGTQRDVFLVDVGGDRLAVDDRSKRDPLARWPDGSAPDGPPAEAIREIQEMRKWNSPVLQVMTRWQLVPVRVQAYGRGTYAVVSLAGWHDKIQLDAPSDVLKAFATDLCQATGGMPMGVLSAQDRTKIMKVRCPAATVWDTL
jgi:hypothetical protein